MNILQTARETFGWAKSNPNNAELKFTLRRAQQERLWSNKNASRFRKLKAAEPVSVILKKKRGRKAGICFQHV